jgi:tRNA(Arg) A34 adenosine deaminase TadA
LLASASNSYGKTHPIQARFAAQAGTPQKIYLHAEIAAIILALKKGTPHSIFVSRTLASGTTGLAAPCPICTLAIKHAGIKEVTYTL